MSQEQLKAFLQRAESDPSLQDTLQRVSAPLTPLDRAHQRMEEATRRLPLIPP